MTFIDVEPEAQRNRKSTLINHSANSHRQDPPMNGAMIGEELRHRAESGRA